MLLQNSGVTLHKLCHINLQKFRLKKGRITLPFGTKNTIPESTVITVNYNRRLSVVIFENEFIMDGGMKIISTCEQRVEVEPDKL